MALAGDVRHFPRRASSPASYLPPHSQIEILLSLPDVRIVEFKSLGLDSKSSYTNEYALKEVEPGTLPWTSRFERTVAVGSLRIYRAPESIAFLNCQNAIRPILPKSQAWCVDGDSKFVLGSPPLFWRIEVSKISHDDDIRVEELKRVLDQILKYEKTPCPFCRRVIDDLSTTSMISMIEKSQTPTHHVKESIGLSNNSWKGFENYTFNDRTSKSERKTPISSPQLNLNQDSFDLSEKFSNSVLSPNYLQISNSTSQSTEYKFESYSNIEHTYGSSLEKDISENIQLLVEQKSEKICSQSASCDANQTLTSHLSDYSGTTTIADHGESISGISLMNESHSEDSCSSSFQSLKSFYSSSSLSSTPPGNYTQSSIRCHFDPYNTSFLSAHGEKGRSVSESIIAKKSQEKRDSYSSGFGRDNKELPLNLSSTRSSGDVEKADEITLEVPRAVLPDNSIHPQTRRSSDGAHFSRSNSLTPALSNKMLRLAHQVPTKIVRKTSDIFITPSNNLIQLMLGIASKIVLGEWRGVLSNFGEPIHWNFEDDSDDDWLNSDYRNSNRSRMTDIKVAGSWEFD